MLELKVHCDCGQKYKFDVEPVNNQMPFSVACPICKRDGTPKANAMLQQMTVFKPVDSAPAIAPMAPPPAPARMSTIAPPPAAPPPVSMAPIAPPPPAGPAKLRINAAAHAEPAAAPAGVAPPAIAPAVGTAPPPIGARTRLGAAPAVTGGEPEQKGNFGMGLLGALIGALVGSTLYFFIYHFVGPVPFLRYFLALGVGGLTGWLANLLGKGEGSKELGALAAVFTIIGILGAQYFLQSAKLHSHDDDLGQVNEAIEDGGYAASVKEAKEVVKAIPNGTDAEIRMYIAKQQAEEGQAPKLETVSADEVKEFRDSELTNYLDLASGTLTKEQYWAKNGFDPKAAKKVLDSEETAMTGMAVVLAVLKAGIISMIVGAGLAYKLSANA